MEASTEEQKEQQEQDSGDNGSSETSVGRVEEITGVVIEAAFDGHLPEIYNALETEVPNPEEDGEPIKLVCEVQQHLGDDRVRAVAMDATDGLSRGQEIRDTGGPITVPVGEATLGRIFNLLGDVIDEGGDVEAEERWPIHRSAPQVENLTPTTEMFETGHQGRRPARPLRARRQGRPVRRRRRGQDRADPGADPQPGPGARRTVGVLRRRASAPARATTSGTR